MFSKVVNGFEVFEVGKHQLWDWCGWGVSGRQFGCCSMPVECNSDSLALGKYLVVELDFRIQDTAATAGCFLDTIVQFSKPKVWQAERSLKSAIDFACALVITPGSHYGLSSNHIGNLIEIWHVVDDARLWQDWENRVFSACQEVPRCVVCGDDYGVCVRVSVKAGGWRYLCAGCFDTFNRINSLVGRAQLAIC